ncbi:MAG: recombinase RecX [Cyclobacteriaceae bacterium]|nr:MAG: recombinase RecX [Cyclobacteriaceae bacterium]
MINKEKDPLKEAKLKAARYCAYRERAPLELKRKLINLGLSENQIEQVCQELMDEGFVNEQRFALTFARSKFRLKKWGKIKIELALKRLEISESFICDAVNSLPPDEYLKTLKELLNKKRQSLKISDPFVINHKVALFLISKGFEPELAWKELKN